MKYLAERNRLATELYEDGGEKTTGILFSCVLEVEEVVRQIG